MEFLDVEGDGVAHLLQELLHVGSFGVGVAGGFILPGLDDDVVLGLADLQTQIARNTSRVFLKQRLP